MKTIQLKPLSLMCISLMMALSVTAQTKTKVKPMRIKSTEQVEVKTGETQMRTIEQIDPIDVKPTSPQPAVPEKAEKTAVSTNVTVTPAKKPAPRKVVARKPAPAAKPASNVRYITRTKVVRDTVVVKEPLVVPSPPEQVVTTQTEYVHDTVVITRVDTVVKTQTENTYDGYNVPRGDFKKVKLKRDKETGTVWMKRK